MVRLSIRIDLAPGLRIGPGKVQLLEAIATQGSISAAGRALGMSYRRAWTLVEAMNTGFGRPVVEAQTGGRAGGGARLSDLGAEVVARYRAVERAAQASALPHLAGLMPRDP
jgi:molybdate transport system regulatory protein